MPRWGLRRGEGGEAGLGPDPLGVVSRGDEELRGDVASDAELVEQAGGGEVDELVEVGGQGVDRSCCFDGSPGFGEGGGVKRNRRSRPPVHAPSAFSGFRFPPEVILLAVRWYLRYGLCYRDLEELLAERGITVDHVTLFRWVQRFTPELIDAARPTRHAVGDRWFVDETYVKVNGVWRYVYRAVDQHGQVIDVFVSKRRDIASARRFFTTALAAHAAPVEVITDRAPALANVIEDLIPAAFHNTGQYENNRCECDHGRLKARLRPMRGLKTDRTASVVIRGHAFVQNLRRGHYELGVGEAPMLRLATAFDELRPAI